MHADKLCLPWFTTGIMKYMFAYKAIIFMQFGLPI